MSALVEYESHAALKIVLFRPINTVLYGRSLFFVPKLKDPPLAALTDPDLNRLLGLLLDGARGADIRHAILRQWKGKGRRFTQWARGGLSDCRCQAGRQGQSDDDPGMVES